MRPRTLARVVAARAGFRPRPIVLEVELTHLCNLTCTYCDRHTRQPNELATSDLLHVLDEFHRLGMQWIGLDGGEPLAHPDFAAIVDHLATLGVTTHVNSNGILVPKLLDAIRRVALLKVSLDGPADAHDRMRGTQSFERAVTGALAAADAGVMVELRCVLGTHNADRVDELVDVVETLGRGIRIMFQPARVSLFGGGSGTASWLPDHDAMQGALARVEARKRSGGPIANHWGSLRHFRAFPDDAALPCAAGWIKAAMGPEGNLYHCGMVDRGGPRPNVIALGAEEAFRRLERTGCAQCWCARAVEGNLAWGGRLAALLAPLAPREIRALRA